MVQGYHRLRTDFDNGNRKLGLNSGYIKPNLVIPSAYPCDRS